MNRASAPGYDLLKLTVTIILVVILVLMLLRGCATTPAPVFPLENTSVSEPTENVALPAQTETELATDTPEDDTPSPAATGTPTSADATLTPTSQPETETATPTVDAALSTAVTTLPAPTATEVAAATPSGAQNASCNTSVPSRLEVGQTARVVQRLNMRAAASITAPIVQTNAVNRQVEIIGGPVCQPMGERAYLWWQIRLPDGAEGWSAESPLNEATYLLEPGS